MISCTDIDYAAGSAQLLHNLNWHANKGRMTAILGPNGAGKSTLLKTLLGSLIPQRGAVYVNDQPLSQWHSRDLAPIRAYMAQSTVVQLSLPVYEYLALARLHYTESQTNTDNAVEEVIYRLDLHSIAKKTIDSLSGGEWQRVDLARAWCQLLKPDGFNNTLLMLDEPSSALDIRQTQRLYDNLSQYTDDGGTVVIIEHDINLAARFCDDLTLIKQGQIMASGQVKDVFTEANLNTCFDVSGKVLCSGNGHSLSFTL